MATKKPAPKKAPAKVAAKKPAAKPVKKATPKPVAKKVIAKKAAPKPAPKKVVAKKVAPKPTSLSDESRRRRSAAARHVKCGSCQLDIAASFRKGNPRQIRTQRPLEG